MSKFTNLDNYMAKLPADRQIIITDKAKRLSQSIELSKLKPISNLKQSPIK